MTIAAVAVLVLCVLLAALAVFQLALAAGAPWGRLAWGGAHRVLPPGRRVASLVAVVLYVFFASVFLAEARVVVADAPELLVSVVAWVVVAYLALGTVMNALSASTWERRTMTPVSGLLAALGAVVIVA